MTPIILALSFDDDYALYGCLTLESALKNTSVPIQVYLCVPEKSEKIITHVAQLQNKYPQLTVTFIETNTEHKAFKLPKNAYWSHSIFDRLLLDKLCPSEDKILYLDCDILVKSDLTKLFKIDLTKHSIAAVQEYGLHYYAAKSSDVMAYLTQKLALKDSIKYFNSGVLLLNLKRLRQTNELSKAINFCAKNPDLNYPDQDALNHTIGDTYLPLPYHWNTQIPDWYLRGEPHFSRQRNQEIITAFHTPSIIHFSGRSKPWQNKTEMPFKRDYIQHWQQSCYQSVPPPPFRIMAWLKYKLRACIRVRLRSDHIRLGIGNKILFNKRAL